jgi:hypothetical protein
MRAISIQPPALKSLEKSAPIQKTGLAAGILPATLQTICDTKSVK